MKAADGMKLSVSSPKPSINLETGEKSTSMELTYVTVKLEVNLPYTAAAGVITDIMSAIGYRGQS